MKFPSFSFSLLVALGMAIAVTPMVKANTIISLDGRTSPVVEWTPNHVSKALLAGVGTTLEKGDQLKPAKNTHVTVLCGDGTLWQVPSGITSELESGCPNSAFDNLRQSYRVRDDVVNAATEPYILSPRFTLVQGDNVVVRWHPVENATSYRVKVIESIGPAWDGTTNDTQITMEPSLPLEPEVNYVAVVTTDQWVSSVDSSTPFGFQVINPESLAVVNAKLEKLSQAELQEDALALGQAGIYADAQLYSDAIATLEARVTTESKSPAIFIQLAKLYQKVGLNGDAIQTYHKAINLADPKSDLELLTSAQANLAQLLLTTDKEKSDQLQAQANKGYLLIGEAIAPSNQAIADQNSNPPIPVRGNNIFRSLITPQAKPTNPTDCAEKGGTWRVIAGFGYCIGFTE